MAQPTSNTLNTGYKQTLGNMFSGYTPLSIGGTPAQNALNSKINPVTLPPLKSSGGLLSSFTNPTPMSALTLPKAQPTALKNQNVVNNVSGGNTVAQNMSSGGNTGVNLYPPGSAGNAGGGAKPQLTPSVTLPNGTQGFTDEQGNLVDASGNPMPAQNINYQANPAPTYPGLIQQAQTSALGNTSIGQNAADIASKAGKAYTEVGQKAGQGEAGYLSGMGTNPVAIGNAGIVAQNAAAQQSAISQGASQALQGTSQQLTGQNQQTTGLLGAAKSVAPSGNFPFVYDPLTKTFTSGAGGTTTGSPTLTYNPQTDAQTLAKSVIANQIPYSDAVSAMGYAGSVGTGILQTAITSQGGDLTKIQAQQSAKQSNIGAAGTAGVQANQAVFQKAYGDYLTLQNTVSNVDQFGTLLTNGMTDAKGNTINPSDVKYANQKIADIRNQLSSQSQAQFDSTFAALKSKISGLLAVGGSEIPTQITSDANKIIDGSAPIGTLNATLSRIQAEGNILLGNQANLVNTAYSGINNNQNNATTNTTSGAASWL